MRDVDGGLYGTGMMEKKRICEAFGRAAAAYDSLALFQRRVCERMLCLLPEWLPHGFSPENILDGGCGTGFGAQCLRSFWPDARLTGCDLYSRALRSGCGKRDLPPSAAIWKP